jgi:hypothetical protein
MKTAFWLSSVTVTDGVIDPFGGESVSMSVAVADVPGGTVAPVALVAVTTTVVFGPKTWSSTPVSFTNVPGLVGSDADAPAGIVIVLPEVVYCVGLTAVPPKLRLMVVADVEALLSDTRTLAVPPFSLKALGETVSETVGVELASLIVKVPEVIPEGIAPIVVAGSMLTITDLSGPNKPSSTAVTVVVADNVFGGIVIVVPLTEYSFAVLGGGVKSSPTVVVELAIAERVAVIVIEPPLSFIVVLERPKETVGSGALETIVPVAVPVAIGSPPVGFDSVHVKVSGGWNAEFPLIVTAMF